MAFDLKKVFSSFGAAKSILPTSNKVVGIDFGASSLKIVELERREAGTALTTYGELQLGPYANEAMGATVKLSLQKKTEALVDAFREAGVTAKDGVFAIPLSDSFVTVISLAAGEEDDIAPRVTVEARKYIPLPLSEVAFEWSEVTQVHKGVSALTRDVLLVAIQNQSVNDNRLLLDAIAMAARPSEIELFSSLRVAAKEGDSSVAILDLGAGTTKLYVAEAGVIQRVHRIPYGGALATKTIATELSLSHEEAENLKRTYDPAHPHAQVVQKAIEGGLLRALSECKRVIDQYEARTSTSIARIIITGGVASASGIVPPYVAYALQKQVEVLQPFGAVATPAFLADTLDFIGPSFGVALGAALRQFE